MEHQLAKHHLTFQTHVHKPRSVNFQTDAEQAARKGSWIVIVLKTPECKNGHCGWMRCYLPKKDEPDALSMRGN